MPETEDTEQKKPFDNLDLKSISIFGGKKTEEQVWSKLAEQSLTLGWKNIDVSVLSESLARAVDSAYFRIVSFVVEDLDTEFKWHASFLNGKGLWDLEIFDSPKADIEPVEMKEFFGSETFKKIAKKAGWILENARKLLNEVIEPHLDSGELLEVDEVKLAAITHWLSDKQLMENLRTGKFMEG